MLLSTIKMKEHFLKEIEMHQAIIHKIVSFYARGTDDKKDLFQEILLQLWKSYPAFRKESAFSTWMYRVALNTALLSQRKKQLDSKSVEIFALENKAVNDMDKKDRILCLYRAIDQLGVLDRAIALLYLEQKTYHDIGEILDLNINNVGVRVSRIKQKLKMVLSYERKI